MLEGFESRPVALDEAEIFCVRKGKGPPLLLLHGFPQTRLMWHRVAPMLAHDFTVVCADLRGYGASSKPPSTPDHSPYAKSAMARDMVALMKALGFSRFAVAGHDRGARVAYRMALEHSACVDRLAVLDIVPTGEALARADARLALAYWPWSLLSQPEPFPERLIASNPVAIVEAALATWGSDASTFSTEVREAYVQALHDPQTVHAICEEFRAATTLDVAADERDLKAGRQIGCPTLVLWAAGGPLDTWYTDVGGPLGIWRNWAPLAQGSPIEGGHFFPEQNPDETVSRLRQFLSGS